MRTRTAAVVLIALFTVPALTFADEYKLDDVHSSFYFKSGHMNLGEVYGRFNKPQGSFTIDGDKSTFEVSVDAMSIDTGHEKRDEHLRSPDFFNARQFRMLTFKSTAVSVDGDTYNVSGDLTIHGVTRPVTFEIRKVGEGREPLTMGAKARIGFSTKHVIKRSDYGMDKMLDMVGDEVTLLISFEGIKQ